MMSGPHQPHLRYRIVFGKRNPAHFTQLYPFKRGRENRNPQAAAGLLLSSPLLPLGNDRGEIVAAHQAQNIVIQTGSHLRVEKTNGSFASSASVTAGFDAGDRAGSSPSAARAGSPATPASPAVECCASALNPAPLHSAELFVPGY